MKIPSEILGLDFDFRSRFKGCGFCKQPRKMQTGKGGKMTAVQSMIVDPMSLSAEAQQEAKAGQPVFLTKYKDLKTGKLKGEFGPIIWVSKDFVFFPEKEKY